MMLHDGSPKGQLQIFHNGVLDDTEQHLYKTDYETPVSARVAKALTSVPKQLKNSFCLPPDAFEA